MKVWECVQITHHKRIGEIIEEYRRKGWRLHTYQATGPFMGNLYHYLLFERENDTN